MTRQAKKAMPKSEKMEWGYAICAIGRSSNRNSADKLGVMCYRSYLLENYCCEKQWTKKLIET
jgi:hypothetical protein